MPDLNLPLRELTASDLPETVTETPQISQGVHLFVDPAARMVMRHASPRGRLLELSVRVDLPGDWLALHVPLDLPDLSHMLWFGFALRSAADRPVLSRACLRSGKTGGGFHDQFFDRQILSQPAAADHHDLLAPAHCPDLPVIAPWREFILFLPSAQDYRLSLQELRVFIP